MSPALPSLLDDVESVRARFAGGPALVALDFDGTLTEIVDDYAAPRLTAERRAILDRVPGPRRHLAIVSGRSLADARDRTGLARATVVGNHGLEVEGPGTSWHPPEAAEWRARLAALLPRLPVEPWVVVEDKGLTATLHVRPRDDLARRAAVAAAVRLEVEAAGFVLRPGKASWEIRPMTGRTKGGALLELLALLPGVTMERTLYAGDDATDEDAFRALPLGFTARVGGADEPTAARWRLPDPDAVYALLEALVAE